MKTLAICVALLVASCGECDPRDEQTSGGGSTTADGGTGGACLCDCPDGPKPFPQPTSFCVGGAHDGEPCCLGSSLPDGSPPKVGICEGGACCLGPGQRCVVSP